MKCTVRLQLRLCRTYPSAAECCVRAVLRGDLDPRDAGCASTLGEAVTFQRVMLERCGDSFARHLAGIGKGRQGPNLKEADNTHIMNTQT